MARIVTVFIILVICLPLIVQADDSVCTESFETSGEAVRGEPAPWLSGWSLEDKVFNISKPFRDPEVRRLALVFWTTWCIPCRHGMDILAKAKDDLSARGIVVTLINYREDIEKVGDFMAVRSYPFQIIMDPTGLNGKKYLENSEGKIILPKTILIDRDGRVEAIFGKEGDDYLKRIIAGK